MQQPSRPVACGFCVHLDSVVNVGSEPRVVGYRRIVSCEEGEKYFVPGSSLRVRMCAFVVPRVQVHGLARIAFSDSKSIRNTLKSNKPGTDKQVIRDAVIEETCLY